MTEIQIVSSVVCGIAMFFAIWACVEAVRGFFMNPGKQVVKTKGKAGDIQIVQPDFTGKMLDNWRDAAWSEKDGVTYVQSTILVKWGNERVCYERVRIGQDRITEEIGKDCSFKSPEKFSQRDYDLLMSLQGWRKYNPETQDSTLTILRAKNKIKD